MTHIYLHIGMRHCGAARLQSHLWENRQALLAAGVLVPKFTKRGGATSLFMAVSDPNRMDPWRHENNVGTCVEQDELRGRLLRQLRREIALHTPSSIIISASQFCTLTSEAALSRLHAFLSEVAQEITIVAHADEQARVLVRHYEDVVMQGRQACLTQEIEFAQNHGGIWGEKALGISQNNNAAPHLYSEIQAPPHWLDIHHLATRWSDVFGEVRLRPYCPDVFAGQGLADEATKAFDLAPDLALVAPPDLTAQRPSAQWVMRARRVNGVIARLMTKGRLVSAPLWRGLTGELEVAGSAIGAGELAPVSAAFQQDNAMLVAQNPSLRAALEPDAPMAAWAEPNPEFGFRATQYVAHFLPRIDAATRAHFLADLPDFKALLAEETEHDSRHLPHNNLTPADDETLAAPFPTVAQKELAAGSSGKVIVACMKNEAPYIAEWVAYHRSIGVDQFLIYTNDCVDGTNAILLRLQELGIVHLRNNDGWRGNSPQQYALDQAQHEPLVKAAEWIIHIDVDEFINVRCGDGMLDNFLAHVPDATNVAMTWRLFGHNGVTQYDDDLVIDQFDGCAPSYAPKPHTAWGFKTMTKNIGAYEKLSCHRPNMLREDARDDVVWVNGSGQVMKDKFKDRGWRSDRKSIGYDLLQLNHYALRSAESFLIKRQRGRALHVNRSIGLNYWLRMDWSEHKDVSIKRNIPRVLAELARLFADEELLRRHEAAVAWHKSKAAQLRDTPEFDALYEQVLTIELTEMDRVVLAAKLDKDN